MKAHGQLSQFGAWSPEDFGLARYVTQLPEIVSVDNRITELEGELNAYPKPEKSIEVEIKNLLKKRAEYIQSTYSNNWLNVFQEDTNQTDLPVEEQLPENNLLKNNIIRELKNFHINIQKSITYLKNSLYNLIDQLHYIIFTNPKEIASPKSIGMTLGFLLMGGLFGLVFALFGSLIPYGGKIGGIIGFILGGILGSDLGSKVGLVIASTILESNSSLKSTLHLSFYQIFKIKKKYGLSKDIQILIFNYLINQKNQFLIHKDENIANELNYLIEKACKQGKLKAVIRLVVYFTEQEMKLRRMQHDLNFRYITISAKYATSLLEVKSTIRKQHFTSAFNDLTRIKQGLSYIISDRKKILQILKSFLLNIEKWHIPDLDLKDIRERLAELFEESGKPKAFDKLDNYYLPSDIFSLQTFQETQLKNRLHEKGLHNINKILDHFPFEFWRERLWEVKSNLGCLKRVGVTINLEEQINNFLENYNELESFIHNDKKTFENRVEKLIYSITKYLEAIKSNNLLLAKEYAPKELLEALFLLQTSLSWYSPIKSNIEK